MYLRFLYSILFLFVFGASTAQNLSLGKPYTVSVLPNYAKSAPATDITSLTDGKFTNGFFWTKKTTVGWKSKDMVSVTIDLRKISSVGSVIFSTAGGAADVYFPAYIFVFLSNDGKKFSYAGDAAEGVRREYGKYSTRRLSLTNIDRAARWVKLVVVLKGRYLFCDEIEIRKGINGQSQGGGLFPLKRIGAAVDSLIGVGQARENINLLSSRLSNVLPQKSLDKLDFGRLNSKNLAGNKRNIGTYFGNYLNGRFKDSLIVNSINPWSDIPELFVPRNSSNMISYNYLIPKGNTQYGAFVVTNSSVNTQKFFIECVGSERANLSVYTVPYVSASEGKVVADPIVPYTSKVNIKLAAGYSKVFFFRLEGIHEGQSDVAIYIKGKNVSSTISIKSRTTAEIVNSGRHTLNANVWAYLDEPMLIDREHNAADDLTKHYINTVVLRPSILRQSQQRGGYSAVVDYLSLFPALTNILIFPNFKFGSNLKLYGDGEFLSKSWKSGFKSWYNGLVEAIKSIGGSQQNIYFYPYDEVLGESDVGNFRKLIQWSKTAIPGIKFYGTLANKASVDAMLPYLDVAQIKDDGSLMVDLPTHESEIWLYRTSRSARTLSPYEYYRLFSWQAFVQNADGVGFWNYANEGLGRPQNLVGLPLINPASSYSVIYDGPDQSVISSRRWEAFKLGIEDFEILTSYADKFGKDNAKALAELVLKNSDNLNLADSVMFQMKFQLFK